MIQAVSEYVRSIAFFLIFMSFIGIIIPSSKYKSYINILLGFILMIVVITPIATALYNKQNPLDKFLLSVNSALAGTEGVTAFNPEDYEILQQDMINSTYKASVVTQINNLLKEDNYTVKESQMDFDQVTGRIFTLELKLTQSGAIPTPTPFIRIEPFKVKLSEEETEKADETRISNIKKIISDFYNMSAGNIHITIVK